MTKRFFVVLLLCQLASFITPALAAETPPQFVTFPEAELIYSKREDVSNYQLILGSLRKVEGVWSAEHEVRVPGKLFSSTYYIPKEFSSADVFKHYEKQFLAATYNPLFRCEGQACGASNHWANEIFKHRELYGPDDEQFYMVGELSTDSDVYYVVLYVNKRGNQKVYAQLELLNHPRHNDNQAINGADMLFSIWDNGLAYPVYIDAKDQKLNIARDADLLRDVVLVLKAHPQLKLYIVGHQYGPKTLPILQQESLENAQRLRQYLLDLGIGPERLTAHGVGSLVPGIGKNRVELVANKDR